MKDLKGKRLLVLGGSLWKDAIADFAREHGVTLIATGNNPEAGIFKIAQEGYSVDSTDAEGMKKLIREKHIDGVYMGGAEPVIAAACQYLEELGMPCYCTKKQWDYLQDKAAFKRLCQQFDLPVVPRYALTRQQLSSLPQSEYPVITKPTDGCASSGFSVCRDLQELEAGYDRAAEASGSGNVLIEKFVKNDAVGVFLTFSEGKMIFSGLEDKFPVHYEKEGSYVAGLIGLESRWTQEFRERFELKIAKMMASIGIREGSMWIEVFHDGDQYYFNEVGFRYGGTVPMYPVDYFYHINQVYADIYYALTGESCVRGHRSLIPASVPEKKYYAVYLVHLNAGTIRAVRGMDQMMARENMVTALTTYEVGDTVHQTGTFFQIFSRIQFVCDTVEELRKTVDFIHDTLIVEDENGNNMVHRMLDMKTVEI